MGRPYCDLLICKRNLKESQRNTKDSRDKTRSNGFKLMDGRFTLNMRKKFVVMRVIRNWSRFTRGAVDVPLLCLEETENLLKRQE